MKICIFNFLQLCYVAPVQAGLIPVDCIIRKNEQAKVLFSYNPNN